MNTNINWAALAAEFDPADVSFRLQGNPRDGKTSAVVVAYLDSRAVQDRLDEVCGPDGWSFDWQPVVTNSTAVLAAKGTLTIAGVSKSDVGDAGQTEPTKASVSDALKRTAVQWGIGRYLYNLPLMYAECVKYGNSWVLAKGEEDRLRREFLRRQPPTATRQPANAPVRAPQPQQPVVAPDATPPTPPATPSTDPMALTHASALDQKRLYGQLAARKLHENGGFLRNVTGRDVDVEQLRDGRSNLSVVELARVSERLTRMPAPATTSAKEATR